MSGVACHKCNKDTGLEAGAAVFRTTECPYCMADLRCCLMCKFFDQKSYNQCREPQADRVADKEKANFCGFFEFAGTEQQNNNSQNILSAAEALFKK